MIQELEQASASGPPQIDATAACPKTSAYCPGSSPAVIR